MNIEREAYLMLKGTNNELTKTNAIQANYIDYLEKCLRDNVRPLEFVQMKEIDQEALDLVREYVSVIEQMEGKRTTSRDMTDLDAERAEMHNRIIAMLQAKHIVWNKRGDVTDWAFNVVKWLGK